MIKDDIRFIGYIAFYKRRHIIKEKYKQLSREDKLIYKYYVYSRRQLKEYTCDLIWQFLNNDMYDEYRITETMLKEECFKYRM